MLSQTSGAAVAFVPNPLPLIVTALPCDQVPDVPEIETAMISYRPALPARRAPAGRRR
jgi:hypothetical protein